MAWLDSFFFELNTTGIVTCTPGFGEGFLLTYRKSKINMQFSQCFNEQTLNPPLHFYWIVYCLSCLIKTRPLQQSSQTHMHVSSKVAVLSLRKRFILYKTWRAFYTPLWFSCCCYCPFEAILFFKQSKV